MLQDELLTFTQNYAIVRMVSEEDQLALMVVDPFEISERIDLRETSWLGSIQGALVTLFNMNRTGYLIEATGDAAGEDNGDIIIVF